MKCYKCGASSQHLLEDENGDITPVCFNCYYDPKYEEESDGGPFNKVDAIDTKPCDRCITANKFSKEFDYCPRCGRALSE